MELFIALSPTAGALARGSTAKVRSLRSRVPAPWAGRASAANRVLGAWSGTPRARIAELWRRTARFAGGFGASTRCVHSRAGCHQWWERQLGVQDRHITTMSGCNARAPLQRRYCNDYKTYSCDSGTRCETVEYGLQIQCVPDASNPPGQPPEQPANPCQGVTENKCHSEVRKHRWMVLSRCGSRCGRATGAGVASTDCWFTGLNQT